MTSGIDLDHKLQPRIAAVTRVLGRLLHDLKQPLTLIRVIAQDLRLDVKKGRLDPTTLPERLREIERGVDEVAQWLERLQGLVGRPPKGATGKVEAACRKAAVRIQERHSNVEVCLDLSAELPAVRISEQDLEQALVELLEYWFAADQHAGREKPRLNLRGERGAGEVMLEVFSESDRGQDAPPRPIGKVSLLDDDLDGPSLGLASALIQEGEGRLEITESGVGARFLILLNDVHTA